MRKYFILIIILGLVASLNASQGERINWYAFEEAVELASQNPRKIMVYVYTDWCGFCKRMEQETFKNRQVAEYINQNFYAVKFNSETTDTIHFQGQMFVNEGQGRRPAHQLSVALLQGQMSYPTIVYINEELELLTSVPGFLNPRRIEPILRFFAQEHYKVRSWEEFKQSFSGTFK